MIEDIKQYQNCSREQLDHSLVEPELLERCRQLIVELGLAPAGALIEARSLTGGVSSDVLRVDVNDATFCVKFALAKLKVAANWTAPVRRNAAEYRWLEFASGLVPHNVPKLYGRSDALGGFAMEFVVAPDVRNWKTDLLDASPRVDDVRAVARLIGTIHAYSAGRDLEVMGFANQDDFRALRLEPYLISLTAAYPQLAGPIATAAEQLATSNIALVHGDVSPKNILFVGSRPILLDAECATIGDPVFDVAFCLNHFLLKAAYAPSRALTFMQAVSQFLDEYSSVLTWEDRSGFEHRLASLLPMLLLARVDGKSPVEYLDDDQKALVRRVAVRLISRTPEDVSAICEALESELT